MALDDPTLVQLGPDLLVMPTGVYYAQCVAQTRENTRCKNWVETSQTATWVDRVSKRGSITVYDLSWLDGTELARYRAQHCRTHDTEGVADAVARQWEPFDPDGQHAAMVTPLPEDW